MGGGGGGGGEFLLPGPFTGSKVGGGLNVVLVLYRPTAEFLLNRDIHKTMAV